MINPTFASFKQAKNHSQHPALNEINANGHPRTFHQLKLSANIGKQTRENGLSALRQQEAQQDKSALSIMLPSKRSTMGIQHKKMQTQTTCIQDENELRLTQNSNRSKLKVTKGPVGIKKNYVVIERENGQKPPIMGPSLLKNKSFIYSCKTDKKEVKPERPSHGTFKTPYLFTQENSVGSVERKSQEISISVGSSSGGDSLFNSSKFQDSINLRDSSNSQTKVEHKKINFNRKNSQIIYKGDLLLKSMEQSSSSGHPTPSLSLMARDMNSSFEEESPVVPDTGKNSFQNVSINFSKKFQPIRKHKQQKPMPPPLPLTIEEFQILDEMGQGKYGKVYMAQHKETGFLCALKTLSKQKIRQENIEQPLIRQIKIQLYLKHPNIVQLYGFFHDPQNLYLIMQCCASGHLLKSIKAKKIFEEPQILDVISNVFQAVAFLHCHGIIHRDLKPENIVMQNGVYKICDFGWAVYAKGDSRTTFCGTPLYVCPEVLKGNQYDAKADVWGLGVLTYELAFGRVPFAIWNQSDMIKIVKDPVYFPSWQGVSQPMQSLIKSMLDKEPQKRASLNEILSSPLIAQFNARGLARSEIQSLF